MVPSLGVSIRGAKWSIRDRSGRRAQELRDLVDTPGRGARWGVREVIRCR
jgi:hypothetical protein